MTQKKVLSMYFILFRDLKLKKFRTICQNSVLWARFLAFLCIRVYETAVVLNLFIQQFPFFRKIYPERGMDEAIHAQLRKKLFTGRW